MDPTEGFRVARWMDVLGAVVHDRPQLMCRLAGLESRLFRDRIEPLSIEAPVWVTGLARSGTTVLLELLAGHPEVATHRYRDFPPVFTPLLWDRLLAYMPLRAEAPAERAHRDGINVTSDSPEAFEEPLWMAAFPAAHHPARSAVLDGATRNPTFERLYRDHIRKLLLVRGRPRYLAKANYNATRLEYLLALFPDARFVVPVREPAAHVASLMKQHRLFCDGGARHPAARRHLARVGHFEFGPDRRPIHCGDRGAVDDTLALWAAGREAEGWAVQWAALYRFLAERREANPALATAMMVVRYEDLCAAPGPAMAALLDHCRLGRSADVVAQAKSRLRLPTYYQPDLSDTELAAIRERTAAVASRFGYGA